MELFLISLYLGPIPASWSSFCPLHFFQLPTEPFPQQCTFKALLVGHGAVSFSLSLFPMGGLWEGAVMTDIFLYHILMFFLATNNSNEIAHTCMHAYTWYKMKNSGQRETWSLKALSRAQCGLINSVLYLYIVEEVNLYKLYGGHLTRFTKTPHMSSLHILWPRNFSFRNLQIHLPMCKVTDVQECSLWHEL